MGKQYAHTNEVFQMKFFRRFRWFIFLVPFLATIVGCNTTFEFENTTEIDPSCGNLKSTTKFKYKHKEGSSLFAVESGDPSIVFMGFAFSNVTLTTLAIDVNDELIDVETEFAKNIDPAIVQQMDSMTQQNINRALVVMPIDMDGFISGLDIDDLPEMGFTPYFAEGSVMEDLVMALVYKMEGESEFSVIPIEPQEDSQALSFGRAALSLQSCEPPPPPPGPPFPVNLAVRLIDFTATAEEKGIVLTWSTGIESDNAGFRLWRGIASEDGIDITLFGGDEFANPTGCYEGKLVTIGHEKESGIESCETNQCIEDKLIAIEEGINSHAIIMARGSEREETCYSYFDTSTNNEGGIYHYLLEDIDMNGERTFHWDKLDSISVSGQ
ncbi:MAG: hypothetical protein KAI83_09390 [Thiomargarita sp.]|nr:hypothetical protein [Thiomargarita sp.]